MVGQWNRTGPDYKEQRKKTKKDRAGQGRVCRLGAVLWSLWNLLRERSTCLDKRHRKCNVPNWGINDLGGAIPCPGWVHGRRLIDRGQGTGIKQLIIPSKGG